MPDLVMLIVNEDGIEVDDPVWCLRVTDTGSYMSYCSGEVYGLGEGEAEGIERTTKRGGITCPECLKRIKEIKAVKL